MLSGHVSINIFSFAISYTVYTVKRWKSQRPVENPVVEEDRCLHGGTGLSERDLKPLDILPNTTQDRASRRRRTRRPETSWNGRRARRWRTIIYTLWRAFIIKNATGHYQDLLRMIIVDICFKDFLTIYSGLIISITFEITIVLPLFRWNNGDNPQFIY